MPVTCPVSCSTFCPALHLGKGHTEPFAREDFSSGVSATQIPVVGATTFWAKSHHLGIQPFRVQIFSSPMGLPRYLSNLTFLLL